MRSIGIAICPWLFLLTIPQIIVSNSTLSAAAGHPDSCLTHRLTPINIAGSYARPDRHADQDSQVSR